MKKNMYFNRIFVNPSFVIKQTEQTKRLKEAFEIMFPTTNKSYDSPSREFYIQILSEDNEHIFGTYSKKNDPNPFERKRNLESQKTEEIVARGENEILEYYTFFYIDYKTQCMAVIKNQHTLRIDRDMTEFAYTQDINLSILPFFDEPQEEILKKFSSLQSVSYSCTVDSLNNSFHSIQEDLQLVSGIPVKSIDITIKIDPKSIKPFKPDQVLKKKSHFANFLSVKLNGKGKHHTAESCIDDYDEDFKQCYDIIRKKYSRSVTITLPNTLSEEEQFDKVEETMRSEICKACLE